MINGLITGLMWVWLVGGGLYLLAAAGSYAYSRWFTNNRYTRICVQAGLITINWPPILIAVMMVIAALSVLTQQ